MLNSSLVIVDVETTGANPCENRVIEIGLVKVVKGEVVEKFSSLINPGVEIPDFITKLTGIKNEDIGSAPVFSEVGDKLLGFFENSIFVAHNVNFDYQFILNEFSRIGLIFESEKLCTVKLSRMLYPKEARHNLSTIIERFGFECANRHRALDDALVLWEFLQVINKTFSVRELEMAFRKLLATNKKRLVGRSEELVYVYD